MALKPRVLFGPKATDSPTLNGVQVVNYGDTGGTPPPPPTGDPVSEVISMKMNTVALTPGADSYVITGQPSMGKAIVRGDKSSGDAPLMDIDLMNTEPLNVPATITVSCDVTTGGSTVSEAFVFSVRASRLMRGTYSGRWYNFPRDADDRFILEPGENGRDCYVGLTGLTTAQISARHGGATVNGAFFRDTFAKDSGGVDQTFKYGETFAYRLAEDAGSVCWAGINETFGRDSNRLIFTDDEVYTSFSGAGTSGYAGNSPLHPNIITRSFTGTNRPVIENGTVAAARSHSVIQEIEQRRAGTSNNLTNNFLARYFACDGMKTDYEYNFATDGAVFAEYVTLNRHLSPETRKVSGETDPNVKWNFQNDRSSNYHGQNILGYMQQDCVAAMGGWWWGYDYYGAKTLPKIVEARSHTSYLDNGVHGINIVRGASLFGSLVGHQCRGGAQLDEAVVVGANTAVLMAAGKNFGSDNTLRTGIISFAYRVLVTDAGYKDSAIAAMVRARGLEWSGLVSLLDCAVVNSGPGGAAIDAVPAGTASPIPYTGPSNGSGAAVKNGDWPYAYLHYDNTLVANWGDSVDANLGGLVAGNLTGATFKAWGAARLGGTPNEKEIIDAIFDETLSVGGTTIPHRKTIDYFNYCMAILGKTKIARTVGQTCIFRPRPDGSTPGCQFQVGEDWSTGDMPGTVAGDSIKLEGKSVVNSFETPGKFDLVDISLDGGSLEQFGARIAFVGDILTGGTIRTDGSGQMWFDGCDVQAATAFDIRGGRFANTGTFEGAGDFTVSNKAQMLLGVNSGAFTVESGHIFRTQSGFAAIGFDGDLGETATFTLAAGATWEVSPTVELSVRTTDYKTNLPRYREVATGDVSGASGETVWYDRDGNDIVWVIETPTGVFSAAEPISGIGEDDGFPVADAVIGNTNAAPVVTWPKIREVRSGRFGTNAPDVVSTVVLAGALKIDLRGLDGNDTITLVDVDVLSGAFSDVTALGIGARDLTVTVDTNAGTVVAAVSTGTGRITYTPG